MPPPPALATTAFLNSLRTAPNLPKNSWYYLSSVTFALLNRPAEIPRVFAHAVAASPRAAAALGNVNVNLENANVDGVNSPAVGAAGTAELESGYESADSSGSAASGELGSAGVGKVNGTLGNGVGEGGGGGIEGILGGLDGGLPDGVIQDGDESAVEIFNKTREALLKAAAIGGLPKTINAINALKSSPLVSIPLSPSSLPSSFSSPTSSTSAPTLLTLPSLTSRATALTQPPSSILTRGDTFWRCVYGKVSQRVMSGMRRGYEDLGVVAQVLYGHVLSETAVLGAKETGWVLCVGLVAEGDAVAPQLKGHQRGAVNNGSSREEVRAVRRLAGEVCARCGVEVREEGWPEI